jgi:hypothetical protein
MAAQREKIVEYLNSFRQRKAMYIDPVTPEEAEKWLYAFWVGCCACGVEWDWQTFAQRRGWPLTISLVTQMRSNGLTEPEMCDELVAIYIEALTNSAG